MHTVPDSETLVTRGVDTHGDVHVAVALDELRGKLAATQVPATRAGFRQPVEWASEFGVTDRAEIEGTGSYGSEAEVDNGVTATSDAGATVTRRLHETFYGGYAGRFNDPDGQVWEIAYNPDLPLDQDGAITIPDLGVSN